MNNFAEIKDRQIELLIKETTLKGVELHLYEQYAEIHNEQEALQAKLDMMLETADEVRGEMETEE